MKSALYRELFDILLDTQAVAQDPKYHPEGDVLFHSQQVFALAQAHTRAPKFLEQSPDAPYRASILQAAALLHDVGKLWESTGSKRSDVLGSQNHADAGAEMLDGLVPPSVIWLVKHHLDLMYNPRATRARWRSTRALQDLEWLRQWDVQGRSAHASVGSLAEALDELLAAPGAAVFEPGLEGGSLYTHHEVY